MTTTLSSRDAEPSGRPPFGPPVIRATGIHKTFQLPEERYATIKGRVVHPLRSRPERSLVALRDVSFEVPRGEFLGVVGRNGSGKSTLLRCLSDIYRIDGGELEVRGRVAPFIELGVGFNPELAARDNVIINSVMLGMSPRQARERFDAVVEFAELQDFVDVKLKNYSSGMVVRLAFSVTVQVDADVLLFDEVLAVGDASFRQKCLERFQRMKDEGRTVLLVTHDMSLVERFCDRAVLLEAGAVAGAGDPAEIARRYAEVNAAPGAHGRRALDERPGAQGVEVRAAWVEDGAGAEVATAAQGEPCSICAEVAFRERVADPVFELSIRDDAHRTVFATSSRWAHGPTGRFEAGGTAVARARFDNHLAPGRYTVSASVTGSSGGLLDARSDVAELAVHAARATGGVVDFPHTFEVERG